MAKPHTVTDGTKRAPRAANVAPAPTTALRRCIGSAKFGIAPHDAPIADFPKQPSQPGGLGRMCSVHWKSYVRQLGQARKAAQLTQEIVEPHVDFTAGMSRVSPEQAAAEREGIVSSVQSAAAARVATKRAARLAAETPGQAIVDLVEDLLGPISGPESATATERRAAFEARLEKVGVASDAGQAMLERHAEVAPA